MHTCAARASSSLPPQNPLHNLQTHITHLPEEHIALVAPGTEARNRILGRRRNSETMLAPSVQIPQPRWISGAGRSTACGAPGLSSAGDALIEARPVYVEKVMSVATWRTASMHWYK